MIKLGEDQQEAFDGFKEFISSDEQFFILKGGSGSGKTTLTGEIVKYLMHFSESLKDLGTTQAPTILCAATTNKAAWVLAEKFLSLGKTSDISYGTVHAIYGLSVYNDFKTGKQKLNTKKAINYSGLVYLFVDEASMADLALVNFLKNHITPQTKMIVIGDPYQLPPVNEREATAFNLGEEFNFTLKTAKRFAIDGGIAALGEQFKSAVENKKYLNDIFIDTNEVKQITPEEFQSLVDTEFANKAINDEAHKILTYTNDAVLQYNAYIRELNELPALYQKGEVVLLNSMVREVQGDSIIPTETRLEILHDPQPMSGHIMGSELKGAVEYVTSEGVIHTTEDFNEVKKYGKFLAKEAKKNGNWATYYQFKEHMADLRMTYASTIHKSQGSTHETVYVDLDSMHGVWDRDLFYRLMYVAVTRAKKQVYLVGDMPENYGRIVCE